MIVMWLKKKKKNLYVRTTEESKALGKWTTKHAWIRIKYKSISAAAKRRPILFIY